LADAGGRALADAGGRALADVGGRALADAGGSMTRLISMARVILVGVRPNPHCLRREKRGAVGGTTRSFGMIMNLIFAYTVPRADDG